MFWTQYSGTVFGNKSKHLTKYTSATPNVFHVMIVILVAEVYRNNKNGISPLWEMYNKMRELRGHLAQNSELRGHFKVEGAFQTRRKQ